jgi:DNA invertase Pin-like site-specific DNA recombinase
MRAGLYARVSTGDQNPQNQLDALRAFAAARKWVPAEFVDHGFSGAGQRRPGLEDALAAARSRRIDVLIVTKLDRLARSTHHLVALSKELEALGVDLVVLDQAIDTTTPSGRLLFHVLAAIAEFERDLIRERVIAGLRRAQAKGTKSGRAIGRPRRHDCDVDEARRLMASGSSLRAAARALGVSPQALHRLIRMAH